MTINELNKLAEEGYITDVTLLDVCAKNPEMISNIDFNNFVSRIVSPVDSVEEKLERGEDIRSAEEIFLEELLKGHVNLTENVMLSLAAVVTNKTVVDLNTYSISGGLFAESNGEMNEGNTDSYAFWVKKGGDLTINADKDNIGGIKTQDATYSMNVWAQGGKVTINGGRFINDGEGSDLIYASDGGKVYIYGGEFHPCAKKSGVEGTADVYTALNIKDKDRSKCEIAVYGGTFYNFNPADNQSEGPATNFVASGYESVEIKENVWEVRKIVESPIVVEEA